MRKTLSILMVLALMTALFVSCSQDNVGNAVTNDLVSVSFTTGGARALTVSRETFDENNYVWYYKAQKADSTGLTTGAQSTWTPVKPLTEIPRTGLSGAKIDGISQGLWNFELQAYAYDSQDPQTKDYPTTGVAVWNGKVTNQPVKKGEANIVNVTVSAIATGNGTINWSGISGMMDLGGVIMNLQEIIFVDPDAELKVPTGMKVYISATAFGATEPVRYTTIDASNIGSVTGLFEDVEAGPYLFNAVVFSGASVDAADFVYADETIAINVYSVLQTIIKGYISELASYVEFGEPVANAVIEATTESVIDVTAQSDPVSFVTESTQSTSYQAASIPAVAVVNIKDTVEAAVPTGSTLSDLALALNVEDKGSTDATDKTTKNFEISLDAIVTTTDETSGTVSVESSSITGGIADFMTVQLYIGKDLEGLKVYHNGVEVKKSGSAAPGAESYEYDDTSAGDGILTLHVNHFSPFSVEYSKKVAVARLIKADGTGSDFYSLQEAIDAADDGDTVLLLVDITTTETVVINKDITVDGNDKTITIPESVIWGIGIESEPELDPSGVSELITPELKNVTVDARNSEGAAIYTEGLFLHAFLTNVTIYGKGGGITVCGACDDTGKKMYESFATLVNVTATTYGNRNAEWRNYAVSSQTFGTLIIDEGTVINATETTASGSRAIGTMSSPSKVVVNDGTINGKIVAHYSSDYSNYTYYKYDSETKKYVTATNKTTISIADGTFNGEIVLQNDKDEIVITGGTFDADPCAYVPDGYEVIYDVTNKVWIVNEAPAGMVARIGTTYYATIQDAIAAAGNDDVVELLRCIDLSSILFIDKTVTIEGHNHDINNTANRVIRVRQPNTSVSLRRLGIISKCEDPSDVRGISIDSTANDSSLTLDGCRVFASYYAVNCTTASNLTVTIKNATVSAGWAAINSYSNNSIWKIEDSILIGINDKSEGEWNNFNTITFDGNALNNRNVGQTGSGNTITLKNTTVGGYSETSNKQYWLGLQYGAQSNVISYDNDCQFINEEGEDISTLMNIGCWCNNSTSGFKTYYNPNNTVDGVTYVVSEEYYNEHYKKEGTEYNPYVYPGI